ncbi:MAG: hypothetical protein JXA69_17360, partial [Phycisphaerae bacterium]|nr:hypothetical protein [Phycisphaerae bacterium]
ELREAIRQGWHRDDVIFALDWCWDALSEEARRTVASALVGRMKPFDAEVSPLDHVAFHPRICDVAAAIVLVDTAEIEGEDVTRLRKLLDAAQQYLEGPFVRLWQEKGPAPTSSTNTLWAQADAVLAAEIWSTGTGCSLWLRLGSSLGKSLDLAFWSYTGHSRLPFGFPLDDGTWAPDRLDAVPRNWNVAMPWVLAARTGSASACWFARHPPTGDIERFAWSEVLYGQPQAPAVFQRAAPLARRVADGFVVMRTDWSPDAAVVLADVGQPLWRSRQHADAGHFQLFRSGRLTTSSGPDVDAEAVPGRGGSMRVDNTLVHADPFAPATLAHNCVTVVNETTPDPRPAAVGNQRRAQRDYRPSEPPIGETDRRTGGLIAFETNTFYSYAAADLAPAYPPETLRSYVRHFLLLEPGVLFVLDQVALRHRNATATWHLQLPARPWVSGGDLPPATRTHGDTNAAGIWLLEAPDAWLDASDGDGRLFVRTVLPVDAMQHVIGGPHESQRIPAGPLAGRPYYGSSADGYERWLWPARFGAGPQAWFRLGEPLGLGPQFGLRSNWGRLDVSPRRRDGEAVFLHVLVPVAATVTRPPAFETRQEAGSLAVRVALPRGTCVVTWQLAERASGQSIGEVSILHPATGGLQFQRRLATTIEADRQ